MPVKWEVIHGDCLTVMPELIERGIKVDACITDPPYGTTACAWDSVIPFAPMWLNLKAVCKKRAAIVLFGAQPFTSALVMSNPQMFRYELIWEKSKATGHASANVRPLRAHENILLFSKERHVYEPQKEAGKPYVSPYSRTGNVYAAMQDKAFDTGSIRYDNLDGGRYPRTVLKQPDAYYADGHFHPTQKPVQLMRYLIRTYTNRGDTVLDITCGSGSTGVACAIEGRNFIGIELDGYYAGVATARILRARGVACDVPKRTGREIETPLFAEATA